jgi:hypothetical protein
MRKVVFSTDWADEEQSSPSHMHVELTPAQEYRLDRIQTAHELDADGTACETEEAAFWREYKNEVQPNWMTW